MIHPLVKGRFQKWGALMGAEEGVGGHKKAPGSGDPGAWGRCGCDYLTVRKNSFPVVGRGMVYGLVAPPTVTHEPRLRSVELCRVPV